MVYRKKITVLLGIIAALTVIYIVTFIFDPDRIRSRSDMYSWLDPGDGAGIASITIANTEEDFTLVRQENNWIVLHDGRSYPARRARIEDLITALTRRSSFPVRSASASSHERLSLTEGTASRISAFDGSGMPLINLLVGQADAMGQGIYLRKQGQNEVRFGQDVFSAFIGSSASWHELRFFPETETGELDVTSVQRLTVYPPADDEENPLPQIFIRSGRAWAFNFHIDDPDMTKVDNYIRNIINTSGQRFADSVSPDDPLFNHSRIILELGNGSIRAIHVGPPDEEGWRFARVSGSDMIYSLPSWTGQRLFNDTGFFQRD